MKQAAILAGGKGSRLSKVFSNIPKPMVPIAGKPLLEYTVELLAKQGVNDLVFFTGFESKQIENHFGDGSEFGVRTRYVVESEPLGSAGSLLQNLKMMAEDFFVVYGDTLFDVDLSRFAGFHQSRDADISLFLHPNDHPYDSDLVEVDAESRVTAFHKTPHNAERYYRNLVNAALYAVSNHSLSKYKFRGACDFARDVFPGLLVHDVRIFGYISREYIKDMGTPDRFERVERDIKKGKVSGRNLKNAVSTIFLDRDGTLTRETDYVRKPEDLELLEGAGNAVAKINASKSLAVLATNQPVIARGDVTEEGLRDIHNKLETLLGRERSFLDAIYFCPHHPDRGFKGERAELKIQCECRKPGIAMVEQATKDLNIDLSTSWFVGDTTTDMLTAKNAGLKSVLVRTGFGGRDRKYPARPDFEVSGIGEAIDFIVEDYERIRRLLEPSVESAGKKTTFVIAGPARSGKSLVAATLRQMLCEKAGIAHVVSLDHWLKPEDQRGPTVDQRYDLGAIASFV